MNKVLVIEGDEVWTSSRLGVLRNGKVLVKDGRIADVGKDVETPVGAEVIHGSVVTPGLIDAHTHLGLYSLLSSEWLPMGVDSSDPVSPHLRVIDGLNPFDKGLKDALSAGVTTVVASAGAPMAWSRMVESTTIVPGTNALLKTNARVIDEAAAIKMAVGDQPLKYLKSLKLSPNTRMGIMSTLRSYLSRARRFMETGDVPEGAEKPKMEALMSLLKGEYPAHVHAHKARDIISVMRLAEEFSFKPVFIHATEAHMVADEMAAKSVPAVLGPLIFPKRGLELINLDDEAPAILEEKGVLFAISTDHPATPIEYLPINVGLAEGKGLQNGLKTVTENPARILGLLDRMGSLEPGKDADVVVFSDEPFEIGGETLYTVIDGRVEYRGE